MSINNKQKFIIGSNYSLYPQPLRSLLEKRREIYKTCYDNYEEEDFKELVKYVEDKIKLILTL